ncbi:MAG: MFS transporter [Gemmatimonadota bacterium]
MEQREPRLPRAVYWFGATSLANDLSSEMIYPLLPAFVGTLGGGALALGVLDGLADAVAAAFKLLSGYLADRPRLRGPLVVAGYAIAAAVRPFMAAAGAAWHVIGLRAVDRLGKGVRTAPRDTMIAGVAAPEIRGRAFGVHRAADHVGAIVGPLLAAALIAAGFTVRSVFWIAVLPGAVAVALAWVAVKNVGSREPGAGSRTLGGGGDVASRSEGTAPGSRLPSLLLVLALAAFLRAPETLLILRAQDLGVPIKMIPILWAALHVVRSASSYPGGALADRWGPRRTLALGWMCYAALAWAFGAAHTTPQAWAVFLSFGVVSGLTESPERKLIAGLVPAGRHGRGFGWYHGSLSAVALPGAVLFGWLYQSRGSYPALMASAATTLLATVMLGVVGRDREA